MQAAGGAQSALPNALTEGFQIAFLVGAGFAVVGAILAATLISSKESRRHAEAAQRGDVAACPLPPSAASPPPSRPTEPAGPGGGGGATGAVPGSSGSARR